MEPDDWAADAAAAAAACIANSSLCSVAGLYWFDDLYDESAAADCCNETQRICEFSISKGHGMAVQQ